MADLTRLELGVDPTTVLVIGLGGEARERRVYAKGEATDEMVQRQGGSVRRLSGVAVSVCGRGLDGAVLETSTPLESVPAGAIFRAEGEVSVSVRADAKPGFNGGSPRGSLAVTVYVQTLTPIGDLSTALEAAASGNRRRGGEAQ
ncbi:hypothetical protein [Rhodococcus erythropolis]|uniref:hypothetical protein n=1 Tax=Rhodococcus erythropolis TaxID=1833 RepID=UPI00381024BD